MSLTFALKVARVAGCLSLAAPVFAQDIKGQAAFEAHCSACHAIGGVGTPGLAPPLNRPAFWAGFADAPAYVSGVLTHGLSGTITAAGQQYFGLVMPAQSALPPEELALAASYVLRDLGGLEAEVTPETLSAAAATKMTAADLRALRPLSE